MNHYQSIISIIGAGAYGSSLAIALARNGQKVTLWGHNPSHQTQLQVHRSHRDVIPNVPFPKTLLIETSLMKAIASSRNVLLVIPSHVFGDMLQKIKPYLRADSRIIWATKGLEHNTGRLLQNIASEILGDTIPLAVLSGPTFAKEVAEGLPTAMTLAATDKIFSAEIQQLFNTNTNFRVYSNPDLIGVQLGGAVKNVIAIGTGMSDGLGFGANSRAALITRGLAEMSRLGLALHANLSTFMGMAGLGDLVLTCTDNQSRNRRFGILLGQGSNIHNAKKSIGQIVEGWHNTKEIYTLAIRHNIEMPITEQVYRVLYCGKNAREAAYSLLCRKSKDENNSGYNESY
ncbi:NAD(P)H-dependent glycerol-3-phosphate dehydrogenase [Candidatus Erwinia haradaeae]|uniref:Glycerol-3-phosphate dehydrogenase [NAD(P)+] n=1 Tax=Candidatus Erwinia haradaeae TaxID=1922217 RepID=A0A451D9F3_9GAMM|nr:NAD(P)H-dependent glycerol-3-phosphate dehydrogenase [Candidatus Erwinia haradaeae]VFP82802.1 Glycerol-3-phosphate dehydrogenase [NAD(P)+] [Candidatus Erwinia haradaeae]